MGSTLESLQCLTLVVHRYSIVLDTRSERNCRKSKFEYLFSNIKIFPSCKLYNMEHIEENSGYLLSSRGAILLVLVEHSDERGIIDDCLRSPPRPHRPPILEAHPQLTESFPVFIYCTNPHRVQADLFLMVIDFVVLETRAIKSLCSIVEILAPDTRFLNLLNMVSTFKLLAFVQLILTCLAMRSTPPPRQELPPFKRTNNNTWIVPWAQFNHPGPALKPVAENVGGISFDLRRTIWQKDFNAHTITFVPVAANNAVHCSYGLLRPVIKSEWRLCSGFRIDSAPPGDESMTDELNNRLRFRLSNLTTSPSGNFQSVTLEIVNHVTAKK
jgi:hypothetical protein